MPTRDDVIDFLTLVQFTGFDLVTAALVSIAFAFAVFYLTWSTAEGVVKKTKELQLPEKVDTKKEAKKAKEEEEEEEESGDGEESEEESEGDEDDKDDSDDESESLPLLSKVAGPGEWKMVLLVRTDLDMGKGKAAAQCCHATLSAIRKMEVKDPKGLRCWEKHGQAKVTLKCPNEVEMLALKKKARAIGLVAESIRDAGRTQIAANSRTVLAVGPGYPIVTLDLEWFDQTNGKHLTEIGAAIQLTPTCPINHLSIFVREHSTPQYKSRSAVQSSTGFIFGDRTRQEIVKAQITATLRAILQIASTLVLHNGTHDKVVLARHQIHYQHFKFMLVDTGALYATKTGVKQQISLQNLLMALGHEARPGSLHDAGNDAAYTLIAYKILAFSRWGEGMNARRQAPPQPLVRRQASLPLTVASQRQFGSGTPPKSLRFFEAFHATLEQISLSVRVASLATVDQVKECYLVFKDFCVQSSQKSATVNLQSAKFAQKYQVVPNYPAGVTEFSGSPSSVIHFLKEKNVFQKFGPSRNKIAFLSGGLGDDGGVALKYSGRINVSELQGSLCKSASRAIEDGSVGLFSANKEYMVEFEIHNGFQQPKRIVDITFVDKNQLAFFLPNGIGPKNTTIPANGSVMITMRLTTTQIGYFTRQIVIWMDNYRRIEKLVTYRVVADAENPTLHFPAPTNPYKPRPRPVEPEFTGHAVPGEAPPRPPMTEFKYQLPKYSPPPQSMKVLFDLNGRCLVVAVAKRPTSIQSFINEKLCSENFALRFHSLLYLEEFQMVLDIRAYDQIGEELKKDGMNYELVVPGLAEARPSLLYGDKIIVKLPNGKRFEGRVWSVKLNSVLLRFHKTFHNGIYIPKMRVDIEFNFSRTCLWRAHRSLDLLGFAPQRVASWTCPTNIALSHTERIQLAHFQARQGQIVKDTHLNESQMKAISHILTKRDSQTPFVMFGPPGTGKTKTLVEAVKTLLDVQPNSRVLICAPSNAAVDILTHRLSTSALGGPGGLPPSQMLRVNAYTRSKESVPVYLESYCKYDDVKKIYVIPTTQLSLKQYRVVCSTLFTASALMGMGAFDPVVGPGGELNNWFTHIFVDEAGHSTETELWAGIGGAVAPVLRTLKERDVPAEQRPLFKNIVGDFASNFKIAKLPQLVIVGDPKQLGPIVRSDLGIVSGYAMSYLERLVETCSAYSVNHNTAGYQHPHNIVQLVNNYRSHSAILELYSKTFYNGTLVCSAVMDPSLKALNRLSWLPNGNEFPLVFHGIAGKDEREGNSPSWFNGDEVKIVIGYLKTLLLGDSPPFRSGGSKGLFGSVGVEKASSIGLGIGDIGIITPYRKQIDKIRAAIKLESAKSPDRKEWTRIRVGTVEEFQGDEKKVILISTVRSSAQWIERDQKFNIGFLNNPKRFNVSISRAKALMIVVGNAEILCGDIHWNKLVRYCESNNACVGIPPPANNPAEYMRQPNDEEEESSGDEEGNQRDVTGVPWVHNE
ncbi:UNVERIFIED_CONTAM: Helicase MOV-10 [Siphonaria sp. JEL0065]|nr:Helicase MOV-10 [Siphonaria sp. JEL0065]